MTSDPRILTKQELLGILGTSAPAGDTQINSVKVGISSCRELHVDGTMSITGEVVTPFTLGSYLTTTSGNLVLNPVGPSIDCSGKSLINFGGIVTNPNRYDIAPPAGITTSDATPTSLLHIPTTVGATYTINTDVACADTNDNLSSASFNISLKAKNIGGVITITSGVTLARAIDTALIGISITTTSNTTDIIIEAVGLLATTIKWYAAAVVTRQLF